MAGLPSGGGGGTREQSFPSAVSGDGCDQGCDRQIHTAVHKDTHVSTQNDDDEAISSLISRSSSIR